MNVHRYRNLTAENIGCRLNTVKDGKRLRVTKYFLPPGQHTVVSSVGPTWQYSVPEQELSAFGLHFVIRDIF